MKKMPDTKEFCKRTVEIAGEIVKVIYDFTVGSECISEVDIRLRIEMGKKRASGCRLQNPGADSMSALRCLYRSTGRWDDYWNDRK